MALAVSASCHVPAATAEEAGVKAVYYVDFRARTAATYGHAFIWYGRMDRKEVEVAGLHPASDSPLPYLIGQIFPVPSETGASYGDLDEQYLTGSYRVAMTEAQAKPVFAYIKQLQASSPVWNATVYNCISFIQDIARYMGLRVPGTHVIYPDIWVNRLRQLNGGRENQVVALSNILAGCGAQDCGAQDCGAQDCGAQDCGAQDCGGAQEISRHPPSTTTRSIPIVGSPSPGHFAEASRCSGPDETTRLIRFQ